jgi:DNA helicase-2/ATP-dependent DNA helicase PcrA
VIDPDAILAGLNDAQREAASVVKGPVAILAGAGTGKTTTITHRIAYQVATEAFPAERILAVTFTEKAARALQHRLSRLEVTGVEARTFHAAALSQLSRLWSVHTGEPLPQILDSKAQLIASLANALPPPHRFLPRSELAGEIEWAKNRMIAPAGYLRALEVQDHQPPIPAELMQRVFDGYERRKERTGRLDFEDMIGLAVRLFDRSPEAADAVRRRLHAFTVDEYQDVNPLQQALLERWLGDRDEVCVVGDDYQTIYSFTGASPEHLLGFPERYPGATIVRLEENYRSSPQVLTVANALAARLGGFAKELRATRAGGPNPTARMLSDADSEVAFVVGECRRLHDEGIAWEEMAILSRINARSEPFEEAFAGAGIPYQVRDGAFLRRTGPRAVVARLRHVTGDQDLAAVVEAVTTSLGFDPEADPDDDQEVTRQADLGRLRTLAQEHATALGKDATAASFVEELGHRFAPERQGRGVQLMTYHRAKGLEFDAVFLPRLLDGELPYRSRRAEADPAEERRLFYVGITRSRAHLFLSWPREPRTPPSPFLQEIGVVAPKTVRSRPAGAAARGGRSRQNVRSGGALFDRLKEWRRGRARNDGVPAYVVFPDATLVAIAEQRPSDWADLAGIAGVGPAKLERYADDVLAIVANS